MQIIIHKIVTHRIQHEKNTVSTHWNN